MRAARLVWEAATTLCCLGAFILNPSATQGFDPVVEYDWGSIRCLAEVPLADADRLQRNLLALRSELEETLSLELPPDPIEFRVYGTRRQYLDEVSSLTPDVRRQRGVFVVRDGRACVFSFQQRELETTLRHEATHAWLHSALPYVPLWLDEGIASYFEMAPGHREQHPYLDRLQWSLQFGWKPDVKKLQQIRTSREMGIGDYRHAWGWVHFLLHDSEASRVALSGYIGRIAAGEPPQSFSEYLEERIPGAAECCVQHLERLAK
jgi:hypothetical protein